MWFSLILFGYILFLQGCGDLFAKQKAIHSVQNYRLGKYSNDFKGWLETKMEEQSIPLEKSWDAGRLKRGFWVVQVSFTYSYGERHFLYYVDLNSGEIRGADGGASQSLLKEFEASDQGFI